MQTKKAICSFPQHTLPSRQSVGTAALGSAPPISACEGALLLLYAWSDGQPLLGYWSDASVSDSAQVGDLMVLYARPHSYIHLITSRLPRRITQVPLPPLRI